MPLARALLGLGLGWLMVGMAIMPANASLGPGQAFMASLIVLLFLPAYYVAFAQQARVWRQLWSLPAFGVFLALLAWAALSLCWATLEKPLDGLAALLSVLAFVLGWHAFAANDAGRIRSLLLATGLGLSLCALGFTIRYVVAPMPDGRIIGFGIIATANYAAMLMGAVGAVVEPAGHSRPRLVGIALGGGRLPAGIHCPDPEPRHLAGAGCLRPADAAVAAGTDGPLAGAGHPGAGHRGAGGRRGRLDRAAGTGHVAAPGPLRPGGAAGRRASVRGLGLGEPFTLWVKGQPLCIPTTC
jgi:hypothetical protein